MDVALRKFGKAQGALIPTPILSQLGLAGAAELQLRDGVIEMRSLRRNPREGWADDARTIAEQHDDTLVWPEFADDREDELDW